jgi:hypothetical protein
MELSQKQLKFHTAKLVSGVAQRSFDVWPFPGSDRDALIYTHFGQSIH